MKKYNLPVLLLKGVILFPYNMLKLEFDSKNIDTNVIDMSIMFHDSYILIVNEYDNKIKPKIGILSKIEQHLELPNGNVRVDIKGIKRINIVNFLNMKKTNEPLESIVSEIENEDVDNEEFIVKKLKKELKTFVDIPYISNSVISLIEKETNLDKLIDTVIPYLINDNNELIKFINEVNIKKRAEMLLKYIYQEKELFKIETSIDNKIKNTLDKTQKDYLLREKIKYLKEELGDYNKDNQIENIRNKIGSLKCNSNIKKRLQNELIRYEESNILSMESNVIKDYIDLMISLPWNIYTKDNEDLNDVKNKLDKSHCGLKEVKERIIEYLVINHHNNCNNTPVICLLGPPGVGKTSLAISIAKAINRKFCKISVSGIKDEAEIVGHRKTYIGAMPGRIITSIQKVGCSNPVLLIDEIDKIGTDYNKNVANCLLPILDKEQNKYFSDNYVEEDFDLSKVLFITTANYYEDIPEALRDRLEIINISGYTEYEKLDITKKYLIPKIIKNNNIKTPIIFNNQIILNIIRNYTKEAGVRELERQIGKIIRKIYTEMILAKKLNKKIINEKDIIKYLGNIKYKYNNKKTDLIGVVNGLAYTPCGGDTLPIEVTYFKGKGNLILTGSLGDIMKESATIALNYLKANSKFYKINYNLFVENDIHIHVPEGAIKKDGPSAGIALTLAIYSALTNTKIPNDIAMTGEITLRGHILEIGGLKEKSVGALRNKIKKIIIPFDNSTKDIPKEVKEKIKYYKVKNFKDVIKIIKNE